MNLRTQFSPTIGWVVNCCRRLTERRAISPTVATLGGIPRLSIDRIYCRRLDPFGGVIRRCFEIEPSCGYTPLIRHRSVVRGTPYAFAAAVGVRNSLRR